jgi:hypothetical protein
MSSISLNTGNSASSYATVVQELYVAYFGRPADYFGLQNFETALSAANAPTDLIGLTGAYTTNPAVKSLIDSFGSSAESNALYGGSTLQFINGIYQNLFNRAPELGGLLYWTAAIDSGSVSHGNAALAIAAAAAASTSADAQTITNKVTVASNFTTDLGLSSTSIISYSGSAAAASARALLAGDEYERR